MARKLRIDGDGGGKVFHWEAVLTGVVAGYLASLVCSAALGAIMLKTTIAQETVPSIMSGVGFLSLAIGSGYAALRARSAGWLHGAATGAAYIIVSMVISLILFPEPLNTMAVIERTIIGSAVGLVAGTIGVNL